MRALSIKQPWAWLIINGHKMIENRDWPTRFRGKILIHTGKTINKDGYEWVAGNFPDIPLSPLASLECGGIVGEAEVVDCISDSPSPWFFGKYGFILMNAKQVPFRPYKGRLGFFEVKE